MKKQPKSITAGKNSLKHATQLAGEEMLAAMEAATLAIDTLQDQTLALRRILISERAQVIYYSGKYQAFVKRECVEVAAVGFLDLDEAEQEKYVKQAVLELKPDEAIEPHEAASAEMGKKIILQ